MSNLSTDVVVVGAGVVGLAVARRFALAGLEVVLLEKEPTFGTGTSSRNSEVIHAGLYYPTGSLKADLCLSGREKLYEYCGERRIPHKQVGKLVVATDSDEVTKLEAIHQQALANGCHEVGLLGGKEFNREQGALRAKAMLLSPRTGIIDSHQLMLNLLGDLENFGGVVAYKTEVRSIAVSGRGALVCLEENTELEAACVINCAGLEAAQLLTSSESDYGVRWARGDYFSYAGRVPFQRLVYPVPQPGGLGVHLTVDLTGAARFGPDVTWVDEIVYTVDSTKRERFSEAVTRYWPGCDASKLSPSYSGIRPKVTRHGEVVGDYVLVRQGADSQAKVLHLLGIESPGLTSCLSLADYVFKEIY